MQQDDSTGDPSMMAPAHWRGACLEEDAPEPRMRCPSVALLPQPYLENEAVAAKAAAGDLVQMAARVLADPAVHIVRSSVIPFIPEEDMGPDAATGNWVIAQGSPTHRHAQALANALKCTGLFGTRHPHPAPFKFTLSPHSNGAGYSLYIKMDAVSVPYRPHNCTHGCFSALSIGQ